MFRWSVPSLNLQGQSRQPLLDACREIKSILGDTAERAGLFREGRDTPDISCPVNAGAVLTVEDSVKGVTFRKYRPFNTAAFKDAAE